MTAKDLVLTIDQIKQLYAVSELSTKAHRNNLRLSQGPEAAFYKEKAQCYKRTKLSLEALVQEINSLEVERVEVERELVAYESQLKVSRQRLQHLLGNDSRVVSAIHAEILTLDMKVEDFTAAELGLIEQIETLAKQRQESEFQLKAQLQEALVAKEQLDALRNDISGLDGTLQKDLTKLRSQIQPGVSALLDRVPLQVIDKVAHVVDLNCSGCRLRVSSVLGDRIKRFASEVHYCEDCGRLLLPILEP